MRFGYLLAILPLCGCIGINAHAAEIAGTVTAAAARSPELTVTATLTFGQNGPARTAQVIVCDILWAHLKIDGLQRDGDGKVDFSIRTSALDKNGNVLFEQPWQRSGFASPAPTAHKSVFLKAAEGLEQAKARRWVWRNEVEDHVAGKKALCETSFETFIPSGLGVFGLHYGRDKQCQGSAGATFVVGEMLYVNAGVVNFAAKDGCGAVRVTVRVLDATGEPTDWPQIEAMAAIQCLFMTLNRGSASSLGSVRFVLANSFSKSNLRTRSAALTRWSICRCW